MRARSQRRGVYKQIVACSQWPVDVVAPLELCVRKDAVLQVPAISAKDNRFVAGEDIVRQWTVYFNVRRLRKESQRSDGGLPEVETVACRDLEIAVRRSAERRQGKGEFIC